MDQVFGTEERVVTPSWKSTPDKGTAFVRTEKVHQRMNKYNFQLYLWRKNNAMAYHVHDGIEKIFWGNFQSFSGKRPYSKFIFS
jgi:hypothetical protein